MKNSRIFISILLVLLLQGCALKQLPVTDVYTVAHSLDEVSNPTTSGITAKKQRRLHTLKLAPMQGVSSFSVTDLIYRDARFGQNKYAYSRWSDAPVRLMQTYFQVALEQSQLFMAVVPPTSVSDSDYLLESVLLDFSQHFKEGYSQGVIRMHFYLINLHTKKIIAGKEFITIVRASSNNAAGAALALNQGTANIVRDLVSWLVEQDLQ